MNSVREDKSRVGGSFFGFIPIRSTSNASLYALTRLSLESRGSRKRGKSSQDGKERVTRGKKDREGGGRLWRERRKE